MTMKLNSPYICPCKADMYFHKLMSRTDLKKNMAGMYLHTIILLRVSCSRMHRDVNDGRCFIGMLGYLPKSAGGAGVGTHPEGNSKQQYTYINKTEFILDFYERSRNLRNSSTK